MVKYTENLLQFWTDLILLNKSPNSGRVKIKIAKVTTIMEPPTARQNGHYCLFWGSTGIKYVHLPSISPLGNRKKTLKKNPKLRDIDWTPFPMALPIRFHLSFIGEINWNLPQWVFGVRFQNMALTRLDHRFVDLTRDGHSPTIGSTIHLNWRHGANIWLWQTKQAIVRLARTKFDLTRMVSIFETLPLNSCKLTPRKARQPRPCTPRSTTPLPLLFWQFVWYFNWNE